MPAPQKGRTAALAARLEVKHAYHLGHLQIVKRTGFLAAITGALAAAALPFKSLALPKPIYGLGLPEWRGIVGSQGFEGPVTPTMLNAIMMRFATHMDDRALPTYIQPEELVCRDKQTALSAAEVLGSKWAPPGYYDEETDEWIYSDDRQGNALYEPLRIVVRPEEFTAPSQSEQYAWFVRG